MQYGTIRNKKIDYQTFNTISFIKMYWCLSNEHIHRSLHHVRLRNSSIATLKILINTENCDFRFVQISRLVDFLANIIVAPKCPRNSATFCDLNKYVTIELRKYSNTHLPHPVYVPEHRMCNLRSIWCVKYSNFHILIEITKLVAIF